MADFKQQTQAELAKALRERRDAEQKAEIAEGRYDAAKENKAGAGRGKQGGPTAKQMQEYQDGGMAKKPTAYKKGGKVASVSTRADGIAQRGKTRGRMQ
jgi:hypothetical protein